jgi:glycosyltransferase involved in cell wall biosynthesis
MSNGSLKKILVLSIWDDVWALGGGGGVADEYHFVRRLSERGVELHFLIPEPAGETDLMQNGHLTYHTYPNIFRSYERRSKLFKRLFWARAFDRAATGPLRELAREIRPDVILGFTYYPLKALETVGRELGIPTAVKLFGVMNLGRLDLPRFEYLRKNFEQLRALEHNVDLYIVLNDGTLGDRALMRLGVPPERIVFLPNGMDMEWADVEVDRAAVRREMGLPEDGLLVVTFSRLVDTKRVDHFIDAVSLLDPGVRSRATFAIGGDGPMRPALERIVREKGLVDGFVFTGVIPHERIVGFLKASDVFVGTNALTNMSLPPCEAILCGVPVIAYDNAGTSEVVRDGETGLLVPDGDTRALAEKLSLLLGDTGLRERLSSGAAAFGRRHFVSWEERIEREIEALEGLSRSGTGRLPGK